MAEINTTKAVTSLTVSLTADEARLLIRLIDVGMASDETPFQSAEYTFGTELWEALDAALDEEEGE